jgi:hypothetical protein
VPSHDQPDSAAFGPNTTTITAFLGQEPSTSLVLTYRSRRSRITVCAASEYRCRVEKIVPGLWRWTAPHPEWVPDAELESPDDWEQLVGSVLYESEHAVIFIDPLVPPNADAFWRWADKRVGRRPVWVLTTLAPHRRSREVITARYRASVSRARSGLPEGVEPIVLRGARETMFWLPRVGTLVPGDRILGGRAGGLRLCPESWLAWSRVNRDELRSLLMPLLELPIERVLVSHGQPILRDGVRALRRCLSQRP